MNKKDTILQLKNVVVVVFRYDKNLASFLLRQ